MFFVKTSTEQENSMMNLMMIYFLYLVIFSPNKKSILPTIFCLKLEKLKGNVTLSKVLSVKQCKSLQ